MTPQLAAPSASSEVAMRLKSKPQVPAGLIDPVSPDYRMRPPVPVSARGPGRPVSKGLIDLKAKK